MVVFERKSALEIRLESNRAAPNVPGSVWILGAQEILNATAMRQVGGAQEAGLAQGVQGKSGGMRVAAEIRVACPSAIAPLLGEQRICHFPDCIFPDACRRKSKQLEGMLIRAAGRCFFVARRKRVSRAPGIRLLGPGCRSAREPAPLPQSTRGCLRPWGRGLRRRIAASARRYIVLTPS